MKFKFRLSIFNENLVIKLRCGVIVKFILDFSDFNTIKRIKYFNDFFNVGYILK